MRPSAVRTVRFRIQGLRDADARETLAAAIRSREGVRECAIAETGATAMVRLESSRTDLEKVFAEIRSRGYRPVTAKKSGEEAASARHHTTLLRLLVAAAFGMQVMLVYLSFLYGAYQDQNVSAETIRSFHIFLFFLTTPVLWYGGYTILAGAVSALRRGTANMNTLVALGLLSSYGYSVYITLRGAGEAYYDAVAMITTVIMLGRYFESLGGSSARKGIRSLLSLQPETATRKESGEWVSVAAESLRKGDAVLVRSGERIAADFTVEEGRGSVDTSLLTGETSPLNAGPGDSLPSGGLLVDGTLSGTVLSASRDSRLAHITYYVNQVLKQSPPVQRLADTASKYLTLITIGISLAAGFVWYFAAGAGIEHTLLISVAVLVAACPCALGMATPLAVVIAISEISRRGIIVRRPGVLETAAKTDVFVFDKTGTLTHGSPSVGDVLTASQTGLSRDELLRLAASVEQGSDHPVARAIRAAAEGELFVADNYAEVTGFGMSALVHAAKEAPGEKIYIGRVGDASASQSLPAALNEFASELRRRGATAVAVRRNEEWLGIIGIEDTLVPDAARAVHALQQLGIEVMLLSGDHQETADRIAEQAGIQKTSGGLSPEQKSEIIGTLRKKQVVAMAGDGVNDGPALARASWSLTVAGGTDVAGETSDLLLTSNTLSDIAWFVTASRRIRRLIVENLGWAFGYNLIVLPLAAFGYLRPVIAALFMALSSLLVVGNSLRLRRLLSVAVKAGEQVIDAEKGKEGKDKSDRRDDL